MATSVSSVTSHFPDAENGFTTTTSGAVTAGATTVGLNSVAGYTNGEPVVMVIDPSNAKKQTFTGIMDTSGSQVTGVVWTAGTNVDHLAGATVIDTPTATHVAMMSKGIKVQHKQDGTHANTITTDTINENTSANGVTVDGLNIKDSKLNTNNSVVTNNITSDAVTATKIDWASTGADGGIWWEEIGRTTLAVAGDTISVTSLPSRRFLKIIYTLIPTGGTATAGLRFNADSGNNYSYGRNIDGAAISTGTSTGSIEPFAGKSTIVFGVLDVVNISDQEKVVTGQSVTAGTAGAGNAISTTELGAKWVNTSSVISAVSLNNGGTGDYAIGSEAVVLGHN